TLAHDLAGVVDSVSTFQGPAAVGGYLFGEVGNPAVLPEDGVGEMDGRRITDHLYLAGVVQGKSVAEAVLRERAQAGQASRGPEETNPRAGGGRRTARHLARCVDGLGVSARRPGQHAQVGDRAAAGLPEEAPRLAVVGALADDLLAIVDAIGRGQHPATGSHIRV